MINHLSFINSTEQLLTAAASSTHCMIENHQYQSEYLYHKLSNQNHDSNIGLVSKDILLGDSTTTLGASTSSNVGPKLIWKFIQVNPPLNRLFYIRSARYNEFLCSSNDHVTILELRRKVNIFRMNKLSIMINKKCMWRIETVQKRNKTNLYYIWNEAHNEPLYASSNIGLMIGDSTRRSVYTWRNKPNSEQFIWNISCHNQNILP